MIRLLHVFWMILLLAMTRAKAGDTEAWSLGPIGGTFQIVLNSNLLTVKSVAAGSPGAAGGLLVNDRIFGAFGEEFNVLNNYYVGSVQDLGSAIDRAEANGGILPLRVIRPGTGTVDLSITLPAVGGFGPAYPLGSPKFDTLYENSCAELHTRIMAASCSLLGYNNGWAGLTLLAHPDWNSTAGIKPYRNSINKLRDRAVSYLNAIVLAPVEDDATGYVDPGLENWEIGSTTMFLAEYVNKTGDTSVMGALQRACDALANRVQNYDAYPGHMSHGGVVGDYGDWALNIINVHAHAAFAMAKRAGATIDQAKWDLSWNVLKLSTARSDGHQEDGYVDYGPPAWGQGSGWDASARTPGSIFGFLNYGQTPTADDTDALNRMKGYVARKNERMQIAHAYTVGGVCFTQLSLPYLDDRSQRFIMDNNHFFYQFHRTNTAALSYFGGRGNNGGDSYLDFNTVKLYNAAFAKAVVNGGLPSMPAPNTGRIHVHMKSPWTRWPTVAAKTARIIGLSKNLEVDITDWQGGVLVSGYTAAWSHVSGPTTATFGSPSSASTTVSFPQAGTYRVSLTATKAAYAATELYDFEVIDSVVAPTPASITTHPASQVVSPGGSATFNVGVTGTGPFLYEWKLDGVSYWGQTAESSLTVPNVGPGAVGTYTCVVTTPTGTLNSNSATLGLSATAYTRMGGLLREKWNDLSGGTIANLTSTGTYPRFPDSTSVASTAETAQDSGDNYGERLSGWIVPPTTGSYRFYLSSDDASQLWLSTNADPANKTQRAQITGYSGFRTYSVSTASISLTAGQRYYIEILHKESGGGDHLSLAWQTPGGAVPATGSLPIDGQYLQYARYVPLPADHWKLDETSGSTAVNAVRVLNGSHQNGPLVNQAGANGVTGKGVTYDGSNDRTAIGAPNYNTDSLTITAWVKRNGTQNPWAPVFFSRGGATVAGFGYGDANELRYHWNGGGWSWAPSPALVVPDATWCLVAMCVSPTSVSLHLRSPGGLQSATHSTTIAPEEFNGTTYLGWDSSSSSRSIKSALDDVRVYKSTLAASDIEAIYQQAVAPPTVSITSPGNGVSVNPDNIPLSASATGGNGEVNSVEFREGAASLATDSTAPFSAVVSGLAAGAHSVFARAGYGEWGYQADSLVSSFTVLGSPKPVVTLTAAGAPGEAGPVAGTFTVSRDQSAGPLVVDLTVSGTAASGSDFIALPANVTIPDGATSVNVTLTPIDDAVVDPDEVVTLNLAAAAAYEIGSPASASLTIQDDEGPEPIQLPWTAQNVGSVGTGNGSSVTTGGGSNGSDRFSLVGSGTLNAPTSSDGFHFVSMPVTGDCEITARVVNNDSSSNSRRAGVMIRESNAAGSRHAAMLLRGTNSSTAAWFVYRSNTGGNSGNIPGSNVAAPYWVRLLRSGNSFTSFISADGLTWTTVGTQSIAMGANPLVGLAVASGSTTAFNSAAFDNVVIKRNVVSISGMGGSAAEGNPVIPSAITLSRGPNPPPTALNLSLVLAGSAIAGSDYSLSGGSASVSGNLATVSIPAGSSDLVVAVNPLNDLLNEGTEVIELSLPSSNSYAPGTLITASIDLLDAPVAEVTLNVLPIQSGSVVGGGTFYLGSSQPITATPDANHVFVNWTGSGITDPNNATTTVLIDAAKTVTANFAPIQHALTVAGGTGGSVTGSGTFNQGSAQTITAIPDADHVFVNWTGSGINDPNNATTTVLIDAAKTVTANFAPIQHALTVAGGTGGSASGSGTFNQGSAQTITATPDADHVFVNWTGSGITDPNSATTTVLVDAAKTVTANFAPIQHALTVAAGAGGSATGSGTFNQGGSQTITATPDANHVFVNWTGSGITDPNSATTTVLIDAAKTVTANFAPIQHALTVAAGTGGSATGSGTFNQGSTQTITATPDADHVFVSWTGSGITDPNSATTTVLIDAAKTVTANFAPIQYALTVTAGTGGSATGSGTFNQGSAQTITAIPDANHVFVNWTGSGINDPNSATTTVLIDAAKTVTANFAPIQHALTVEAGTGGSATGSGTFNQGSSQTITATPDANHVFVNWTGSGITDPNSATTTVLIDAAKTVTANFAPIQHALTVNAGEGGSATGSGTFNQGSTQTITATPDANHVFVSWTGSGITDPASATTTVLIDAAKTVTANFAISDSYPAWIAGFGVEGEAAAADSDADGDGTPNRAEMILGFVPTDPNSRLIMVMPEVSVSEVKLRINRVVVAGSFVIQSSTSLRGGWQDLRALEISADENDHLEIVPRLDPGCFYRLVYIPPAP
jgi:hypothetical protein